MMRSMRTAIGVVLVLLAAPARAQEELRRVETAHYALTAYGTQGEVREYGDVLEQTWPEVEELLKAAPKLEGKKLDYRVYADKAAWDKAILDDGQSVPSMVAPVWYCTANHVLYHYRAPSVVYTRMMLIYGAVLQLHALCKDKNQDLDATWYVHGLAQTLCVHSWDGKNVAFATQPRLCVVDYPAKALEALGGKRFGLDPWDAERLRDPYLSWAVVRFALFGEHEKYRAKYQKLALGYTGSKMSGPDFVRSLGREKDVTAEFQRWLVAEQLPFEVVLGDWEDKPDGRIVGGTRADVVLSVAALREPRKRLACRVSGVQDKRLTTGVMLSFVDAKNYVFARFAPPYVAAEWVRDGRQVDVLQWQLPNPRADTALVELSIEESKADPIKKKMNERPGVVALDVDKKRIELVPVPIGRLGLATLGGTGEFSEVRWQ